MLGKTKGWDKETGGGAVLQGVTAGLAGEQARARRVLDVEDLVVWTYRDQVAHRSGALDDGADIRRAARGGWSAGWSTDGCVAVERYAVLGTFVDRSANLGWEPHPDAVTVLVQAQALGRGAELLLKQYGCIAGRPDWLPGWRPRVEPVWKGLPGRIEGGKVVAGKVEMIYPPRGAAVRHMPIACKVELADPPGYAEAKRRRYAEWHDALTALALRLRQAGLRDHLVTGPAAPARPWLEQGA